MGEAGPEDGDAADASEIVTDAEGDSMQGGDLPAAGTPLGLYTSIHRRQSAEGYFLGEWGRSRKYPEQVPPPKLEPLVASSNKPESKPRSHSVIWGRLKKAEAFVSVHGLLRIYWDLACCSSDIFTLK